MNCKKELHKINENIFLDAFEECGHCELPNCCKCKEWNLMRQLAEENNEIMKYNQQLEEAEREENQEKRLKELESDLIDIKSHLIQLNGYIEKINKALNQLMIKNNLIY